MQYRIMQLELQHTIGADYVAPDSPGSQDVSKIFAQGGCSYLLEVHGSLDVTNQL